MCSHIDSDHHQQQGNSNQRSQNKGTSTRSPRSRTIESLHRALLALQQENAKLKADVQQNHDEKERLKWELETITDEKDYLEETLEALDGNTQKDSEELWERNDELVRENSVLARKVSQLELALNTTSRKAEERLHQVLAGQEQLEKALDLVASQKQATPWWQCH